MKRQTNHYPSLNVINPTLFLRERIHEDSNVEMDWLWAASEVTAVEEIRYCLERALYINPNNRETLQVLSSLAATPVPTPAPSKSLAPAW